MNKLVYLDTSVISAYFDNRTPLRMVDTQSFWKLQGELRFTISDVGLAEIERTPQSARKAQMLELVQDLPVLELTPTAERLAEQCLKENLVPAKKVEDAHHLALAVVSGMDYLVSWNFRHMVNYRTAEKLPLLAAKNGYFKRLTIFSPSAFSGGLEEDE